MISPIATENDSEFESMETSFGMHSLSREERVKHMLKMKLLEEQEAAEDTTKDGK